MLSELKNVDPELFDTGITAARMGVEATDHPPPDPDAVRLCA